MKTRTRFPFVSLAALPLVAVAFGCGGGGARAKTPADTVTTTGASVETNPASSDAPAEGSNPRPSAPVRSYDPLNAPNPAPDSTPALSAPETTLSDDQIASIVDAAETAAIEEAREAAQRAKSPRVRLFAAQALADYGVAHSKLDAVENSASMALKNSVAADRIEARGEGTMASLLTSSGRLFDEVYVEARVSYETELLTLLDDRLLPQVHNPDLRDQLESLRTVVQSSLNEGRQIQSALAK